MASIYLVEIQYYDPEDEVSGVLRACSGTGFNAPDAPDFYAPVLDRDAAFDLDRTIWTDDREFGAGKMSLGDIVLGALPQTAGAARPYDFLQAHGCSVREAILLVVDPSGDYADAVVVTAGPLDNFVFSTDGAKVTFRWRDAVAELVEGTAQTTQYLGNNALPNGVEGTDDLKDRWKVVVMGYARNVPAPCVNTAKPIYQFADANTVKAPTADARVKAYARGSLLTAGTSRASLALLLASSASGGTWDYYIGTEGGFARPASADALNGTYTMDVVEGASSADRTVAQIWKRLLIRWGVDPSKISSADVAALDIVFPTEIGLWIGPDEEKRRDVLDRVAATAGAIYWRDLAGVWHIKQVVAPTGSPIITFRRFGRGVVTTALDLDILDIELLAPDGDNGEPVQQVGINYARNWCVQTRDQVYGSVGMDLVRMAFLENQWRVASTPIDAGVVAAYGADRARKVTYDTLINDPAVAATEAARRQALLGGIGASRAATYAVTTFFDPVLVPQIQELTEVRIVDDLYGLTAGRDGIVTRIQYDGAASTATFNVRV